MKAAASDLRASDEGPTPSGRTGLCLLQALIAEFASRLADVDQNSLAKMSKPSKLTGGITESLRNGLGIDSIDHEGRVWIALSVRRIAGDWKYPPSPATKLTIRRRSEHPGHF